MHHFFLKPSTLFTIVLLFCLKIQASFAQFDETESAAIYTKPFWSNFASEVINDYQDYYQLPHILVTAAGFGAAGILANTAWDENFQHWWQHDFRTPHKDNFWEVIDNFAGLSQYKIVIPVYLLSMASYHFAPDNPISHTLYHFGNYSLRTLLIGAPLQAILTSLLGSGRPSCCKSHWHLFEYNRAVSGHAFYGAIPLLNIARMSENPYLKSSFYMLSILPGLARINFDKHYLSQAFLGWWLAFTATNSVARTNILSPVTLNVIPLNKGGGLAISYKIGRFA